MVFHSLSGPRWNTLNFLPKFSTFPFFSHWNFLFLLCFSLGLLANILAGSICKTASRLIHGSHSEAAWLFILLTCLAFFGGYLDMLVLFGVWNVWDPPGMFSPDRSSSFSCQKMKYFGQITIRCCDNPCLKLDSVFIGQLRDSVCRTVIAEIIGFCLSFGKGVDMFREKLLRKHCCATSQCVFYLEMPSS